MRCRRVPPFGGLKAVQDVSLDLPQGTLAALIGPNGAGKTTLFALMSGFLRPDAAAFTSTGTTSPAARRTSTHAQGLARTFQIVQPFAAQTVRENIAVGAHLHEPRRRAALAAAEAWPSAWGLAATRQARRRPHGGRPQAAGTGARAGHPAPAAAARRGAGRAEPAGDRRDDPGGARHRRSRASRC
jgi:ABC-type multidrug transport system ATPase subunit